MHLPILAFFLTSEGIKNALKIRRTNANNILNTWETNNMVAQKRKMCVLLYKNLKMTLFFMIERIKTFFPPYILSFNLNKIGIQSLLIFY